VCDVVDKFGQIKLTKSLLSGNPTKRHPTYIYTHAYHGAYINTKLNYVKIETSNFRTTAEAGRNFFRLINTPMELLTNFGSDKC
jgi:hypothetical protein